MPGRKNSMLQLAGMASPANVASSNTPWGREKYVGWCFRNNSFQNACNHGIAHSIPVLVVSVPPMRNSEQRITISGIVGPDIWPSILQDLGSKPSA
ncbi:hypothetical protein Droror1_Dr00025469 [Drosera rotundifolia]